MGNNIDVSIIIPVYNTAKNLFTRCLSSFGKTAHFRYEVLVIDDCSDECYEIENICKNFEHVQYIKKDKNSGGASLTRNTGIDQACGDFLMFVDSDDFVDLTACDRVFEKEKENILDYDAVCFGYKVIKNGKIIGQTAQCNKLVENIMMIDSDSVLSTKKHGYNCGVVWAKLYNKSTVNDLRFAGHIRYGEDLCFNLKFDLNCKKVYCINECLYFYHLNTDSIGHRLNPNVGNDFNNTISEVLRIYDMQGRSTEVYQQYYWTILFDYLLIYCYGIYVYHKQAGLSRKQRKQAMEEILALDGFQKALSEIDGKYFGFFHRIAIRLLRKRHYKLAHRCIELKRKFK